MSNDQCHQGQRSIGPTHAVSLMWTIWNNVSPFHIPSKCFIAVQTCASVAVGQLKYSMDMKRQLQLAVFLV